MTTSRKDIYELVPPDLLHWDDTEKNFTLLSEEQLTKILTDCILKLGMSDPEDMMKYVKYFESMRMATIFFDRYFKDEISFTGMKGRDLTWVANNYDD
jgi:hypothetical protein